MIIPSIINRRSIRAFTTESISETEIEELLTAAFYAPTAKNGRDVSFIVITDAALREQLNTAINQPGSPQNFVKEAPLVIVPVCSQTNQEWATENIAIATEHILLQATEMGLGGVWKNVYEDHYEEVKKLLGIPDEYLIVNVIPVGHPKAAMPAHTESEIDVKRIHVNHW
jgi:nitroreductase